MNQTRSRVETRLARLAGAYQATHAPADTGSREEAAGGGSAYTAVVDVIFPSEADQPRGPNGMH